MKRILLCKLILLASLFSTAQNNWVQKLTYNILYSGYYDTLTGLKQIEVGADGSLYVLANVTPHYQQYIYKFYPNSNQVEWTVEAGYHFADGSQWTDRFFPTSDSGIVTCFNYYHLIDPARGEVRKYSKDGTLEWWHEFLPDFNMGTDNLAYDVIEISPGRYYVLINDSMVTLDNSGSVIDSTSAISGLRLQAATNGELLVLTQGGDLIRTDTLGNQIWSHPCDGVFDNDTASVFIANSNLFVQKVDALSGNQIWNRNYNYTAFSGIEASHDGGFFASTGYRPGGPNGWGGVPTAGSIFRADSMGDTLWTRTYTFPYYGLSTFRVIPGGNILTGGCYLSGYSYLDYKDHSAFITMMNNDGSYPLQQTGYMVAEDADHDLFRNFVSDALQTMLALGQTGPARDTSLDGIGPFGAFACERSDIAIDWPNFSPNGINYKYADYDGNGIVDTNDINNFIYCTPDSIQLYYRYGHNLISQNNEEFFLVPVNDTILPGDDALYYMIMGSAGNPVDSIYGFAFSHFIDENGWNQADSAAFYPTALGIPGTDLWTFQKNSFVTNGLSRTHTLMCRTDFQNTNSLYDTIGLIRYRGYFSTSLFTPTIADFKAILVDGSEIPFTVSAGSIFIDSSSVKINEGSIANLKIYPNPVSDKLTVNGYRLSGTTVVISVFNILGEKVKELKSEEVNTVIPVEDLQDGYYFGTIKTEKAQKNFSFVVRH